MSSMVVGAMPLLVLMAFAPIALQGLAAGAFNPLLSTADVLRVLLGARMVGLNLLILVGSLCP